MVQLLTVPQLSHFSPYQHLVSLKVNSIFLLQCTKLFTKLLILAVNKHTNVWAL